MRLFIAGLLFIAASGCAAAGLNHQAAIEAAVNDPTRLEDARARDSARKPAEILAFSTIKPGDHIVEIAPAGGYYTAMLSRLIGEEGKIYAVDPERVFASFPQGRAGFPDYIEKDPRNNVEYSSQFLDAMEVPQNLDQIWMVLYYHDTLWTGEDRVAMNRIFFESLKSGGSLIIVDHAAEPGSPESVGQTLHRMDPDIARRELEAAGFSLADTSDVLANIDEDRTISVFDPVARGSTDRFVWRWVKP